MYTSAKMSTDWNIITKLYCFCVFVLVAGVSIIFFGPGSTYQVIIFWSTKFWTKIKLSFFDPHNFEPRSSYHLILVQVIKLSKTKFKFYFSISFYSDSFLDWKSVKQTILLICCTFRGFFVNTHFEVSLEIFTTVLQL